MVQFQGCPEITVHYPKYQVEKKKPLEEPSFGQTQINSPPISAQETPETLAPNNNNNDNNNNNNNHNHNHNHNHHNNKNNKNNNHHQQHNQHN